MIEVVSSDKCKSIDREAIEEYKIPSVILMENAARSVFDQIKHKGESFLILCGKGNNGGDALSLARHLSLDNKKVKIIIISRDINYSKDFKTNFDILNNMLDKEQISYIKCQEDINEQLIDDLREYDVTIDGIFGVGLNRDLDLWLKTLINYINEFSKFVIALDVPSGLDCNLGIERGAAVKANITYTFEVIKLGYLNYSAFKYLGEVKLIKIGIPSEVKRNNSDNIFILKNEDYKKLIPTREVYGHKGTYGRALVVAGSSGFSGAAYITAECTIRSGAGLVTLACKKEIQDILSSKLIEAMTIASEDLKLDGIIEKADSIAFGPGLGTGEKEEELLFKVINKSKCPLVIDADGITLIANNKKLLHKIKGRAIITPHPGEMARLLGVTVDFIEADRINIARNFAEKYNLVVLLKGYNTIITDGYNTYINTTGNSKMASGGMGDALTGIINALVSQKMNMIDAALLGAYIHGDIADKLSHEVYIVNARDVIREIPKTINKIICSE